MRSAVFALVATCLIAGPAAADVLPSRRAEDAVEGRTVVERIAALGATAHEGRSQAAALTGGDLAFFGERPDRVQVVGAAPQDMFSGEASNIWYETVVGAGFLLGGFGLIAYMVSNNE